MKLLVKLRHDVAKLNPVWITLLAAIAAFGCYTSMYAFRKAFAAGTFENLSYFGVSYKVWLVIVQMLGYTFSKFYGIKFISESAKNNRAQRILCLIGISWLALLGFALVPAPYNIIMLFINGFPLGMIWGLVFGYLEGRKTTEFMGGVLSITLIFASGFIKTVARSLMAVFPINEYWMPFLTGLLFVLPLVLFVFLLELIPPPTKEDLELRTKRVPMNASERKAFVLNFLPGIVLTVVIYVIFTALRDMRDNFEVEIWHGLGISNNHIFTQIDTLISVVILMMISLLILVKNNLKAFTLIHLMIILGCVLVGFATYLFHQQLVGPVVWMTMVGTGLFMAYIPYNAIFFERMIANFHYKSNVGFLIYVSDSFGYLASISILSFKEVSSIKISWLHFFENCLIIGAVLGGICSLLSLFYFRGKTLATKKKAKKSATILSKPILS